MSGLSDDLAAQLAQRVTRPQRHRLLQGYPSLPQMRLAAPDTSSLPVDVVERFRPADGVRTLRGALETHWEELASELKAKEQALMAPCEDPRPSRGWQLRQGLEARVAALRALLSRPDPAEPPYIDVDPRRDLIIGVIPHAQCTPRVEGCGFCTFPHDAADKQARSEVVSRVDDEARDLLSRTPELAGRSVSAIYFGGGTANLAAPDQIARLFASLAKHLRFDDAEVSLEGVPALFASWFHAPLKMLGALRVRQRRISMGMQTFDRTWIEQMGRTGFGDERSIRKLVTKCRSMGITTSGDFLFNLPGQPLAAMLDDVDRAIALGLDQICLYNLVLYEGLGTPWSKEPALVLAMPDNETACGNWLALRDRMLAAGFVQTTLTNFERVDVANGDRAFVYERASFSPEKTDAIGFGPMSLSMFVDVERRRAVKLLRRKDLRWVPWSGDDLLSLCEGDDLRLLFVTRSLAKGSFEKATYARFCGSSVDDDFSDALALLVSRGLLRVDAANVALTPRGMFFSDAVVSTFIAEKQIPRQGAGVHTMTALADPTRIVDYGGMG